LPKFHYAIIGLVILDMVIVFVDLVVSLLSLPCPTDAQLEFFKEHGLDELPSYPRCKLRETPSLEAGEWALWSLSIVLLGIFCIELFLSLIAFGPKHFKKPIYAIDAIVVSASLVLEVFFKFADGGKLETAPSAIITLRLWKIVRAIHAIAHSIELKNKEIIRAVKKAKAEVEETMVDLEKALEREQVANTYYREQAPHVKEEDVDRYVEKEMREREKEDDLVVV
jgi:hypothetical protein